MHFGTVDGGDRWSRSDEGGEYRVSLFNRALPPEQLSEGDVRPLPRVNTKFSRVAYVRKMPSHKSGKLDGSLNLKIYVVGREKNDKKFHLVN